MDYCTTADIIADSKGIVFKAYDATAGAVNSSTTLEQLGAWISEESAYMDGVLAKVYALPIVLATYPQAALVLKRICVFRVAMRVKSKNELKEDSSQKSSDEKSVNNYVRTPNDDLMKIGKKELLLIDVPLIDSTGGFSSFTSSSDSCGRTFNTSKQEW